MLEWSDDDVPIEEILTNVSLYWFTQSYPRSIYPYRGLFTGPREAPAKIPKPLGYSYFPHEMSPAFEELAEKHGDLVFYKRHESGGHFAALEKPKELLDDVEEFVKAAWKKV